MDDLEHGEGDDAKQKTEESKGTADLQKAEMIGVCWRLPSHLSGE